MLSRQSKMGHGEHPRRATSARNVGLPRRDRIPQKLKTGEHKYLQKYETRFLMKMHVKCDGL